MHELRLQGWSIDRSNAGLPVTLLTIPMKEFLSGKSGLIFARIWILRGLIRDGSFQQYCVRAVLVGGHRGQPKLG